MSALARRRTRAAIAAVALCAALGAASLAGPAAAAPVPGFDRPVRLMAREQPVGDFLDELFGELGLPAVLEGEVVGTVNGDFDKSAAEVFDDLSRSFQLTLYYDGAIVWVQPANRVRRALTRLSGPAAERLVDTVDELGLTDERNRLERVGAGVVITGAERFVAQVEELVDVLGEPQPVRAALAAPAEAEAPPEAPADAPPGADFEVFRLRYAWADDTSLVVGGRRLVVPGVASLLRDLVGPASPGGSGAAPVVAAPDVRRGLRGRGLAAERAVVAAGLVPDGAIGEAVAAVPAGAAARGARIVADSLNNAILIHDRADLMPGYRALIDALDTEPSMIEIEATIIDLDTDRLRELGVAWRVDDVDGSVLGDGALTADTGALAADAASGGAGGVVSLVLGDELRFLSRIRALESQGAARIVSKPHVITLANVEALLDTSSTFFVRVEGEEEVDLFDVSVGTTLRVTPHVFEDSGRSRIKLLVAIEDGSTSERTVDDIPVVERSSINTQALIDAGQSLLVGGLVREFDADRVSKVPLLGDIPLVGALFRSTERSAGRVERLFLISPRLTGNAAVARRLDAPLLFGEESSIVESAPTRTLAVNRALARRDAAFPPVEALPRGGPQADLLPERPVRPADALPEAPPRRERPVPRDGAFPEPSGGGDAPATRRPPREGGTETTAPWVPTPGDGWQAVGGPAHEHALTGAVRTASPTPTATPAPTATPVPTPRPTPRPTPTAAPASPPVADPADGWQAVR